MCTVCGCSTPNRPRPGESPDAYVAVDRATGDLHYGTSAAGVSVVGLGATRTIAIEADVLGANGRFAEANRAHFAARGVRAFNLLSSPGSGKTTLLCATIHALRQRAPTLPVAVIEGDQQTSVDADRIRATGAPAIQVNTGRGCHLDARMVGDAFARLSLHGRAHAVGHAQPRADATDALLFIENVGNLVCPALWDLGEHAKVVVLSVTEGDDKPLKYPDMFAAAQLMVLNKIDLLPHVAFDVERCIANARRINPAVEVLRVSATRGDGMDAWLAWLLPEFLVQTSARPQPSTDHAATEAALRDRIAALEAALAAAGVKAP